MEQIVKIYDDGEFWIDGKKRAKLYDNGEIWADGKRIAKLYEDGDIWADGKKIGCCTPAGELWIQNQKVASGIFLLSVLNQGQAKQEPITDSQKTTKTAFSSRKTPSRNLNMGDVGNFGAILICAFGLLLVLLLFLCFRIWFRDMPEMLTSHMQTAFCKPLSLISVYACMFLCMYLQWDMGTVKGKLFFFRGLMMQGASFFLNLVVFSALDMAFAAVRYGVSPFGALGELMTVLLGSDAVGGIIGVVVIFVIFGMAPALTGTLVNLISLRFFGVRSEEKRLILFQKIASFFGKKQKAEKNQSFSQATPFGTVHTESDGSYRMVPHEKNSNRSTATTEKNKRKSGETLSLGGYDFSPFFTKNRVVFPKRIALLYGTIYAICSLIITYFQLSLTFAPIGERILSSLFATAGIFLATWLIWEHHGKLGTKLWLSSLIYAIAHLLFLFLYFLIGFGFSFIGMVFASHIALPFLLISLIPGVLAALLYRTLRSKG